MSVYLVRHTRVAGVEGLCYGRTEVALDDGFASAADLVHAGIPTARRLVYTSPSLRCRFLASTLAPIVRVDKRLVELDFGRWENRKWLDIPKSEIDAWAVDPTRGCPPGGESFLQLQTRVLAAVADMRRHATGRTLIVCTHAGPIRALLAHARGLSLADAVSLDVPYGSVHQVPLLAEGKAGGGS